MAVGGEDYFNSPLTYSDQRSVTPNPTCEASSVRFATRGRFAKRLLPAALSLLLVACAAKRDHYDVPDIPLPERFTNAPELVLPPSVDSTLQREGIRIQRLREELLGLTLPTALLFDFGKATIKPRAKPSLDRLVDVLRRHEHTAVRVSGHTDAFGSEHYNRELATRRARAVLDYLVSAGVEASRLSAVGEGEARPVASNDSAEGRRLNRRVEVAPPDAPAADQPARALQNVLAEWWRLLGDPQLDDLIDRALANNTELRIAALRVIQARARADQEHAEKWPTISVPAQAKGEAPKGGIGSVEPGGEIETRHTYQASLRGDWRVDIWGELAAKAESADMEVWNAAFRHDEIQRGVVTEVATFYVEYLSLNDRLRVARETSNVLSEMLDAMAQRMERGDATITDVEQQKAAVHAVEATIPALELRREQVLNRIAFLVGVAPGGSPLSKVGLDNLSLPQVLPGVPSFLVLRRPDVRAVEAQLLGADANIDLARARVLPPLDLSAQVGYGSHYFSKVFEPHSLFWNVIANLSITLFDKGKRQREVDYARAAHEELVETYVRTLYNALVEVEDALITIQLTARRLDIQQRAARAARRAWELNRESYDAGATDYLALLDSERTYHRNLDEAHQIRKDRYQGLVDLFGALGGGVEGREPISGEGERPVPEAWEMNGAVVAGGVNPPLVAGWRALNAPDEGELPWLVELSGLHDQAAVDAGWRDMVARQPEGLTDRRLLLVPDETAPEDARGGQWYRLFIAEFATLQEADRFCTTLAEGQQRCRVVTSRLIDIFDRALQWPLADDADAPLPQVAPAAAAPLSTVARMAPTAAPMGRSGHAVQVGSFSVEANAVAAMGAWRSKGYDAYLRRIGGRAGEPWFAVRIGSFGRYAEAATMADDIERREGGDVAIVPAVFGSMASVSGAPIPESAPAPHSAPADEAVSESVPPAESRNRDGYAAQVGTFGERENARVYAQQWREMGYDAYICRLAREGRDTWFSVRVGAFSEEGEGRQAVERFESREGVDAVLVPAAVGRCEASS